MYASINNVTIQI